MRRGELNRRRDAIIRLLCEQGEMSATDLATRLGVSVQTIRTDLRELDEAALVQRRHGNARLRKQSENIGYAPRMSVARSEKQQIAIAVKSLVGDGSRVALGTGTTVEACARILAATCKDLFVATNNIHAVIAMQGAEGASVSLAGGAVRLRDLDLIGTASRDFFADYLVDIAIFSCGGISLAGEVLDYNTDEIAARVAVAGCAVRKVLVVDQAKLGRELPCRKHVLWDYDVVVSAAAFSKEVLDKCADAGCEVIQVNTLHAARLA